MAQQDGKGASQGREALVTPANVVAVAFIVAVVAASFAALVLSAWAPEGPTQAAGLRALVHDSDGVVHELPLDEDAQLSVETSEGTNLVVVEGGQVRVAEADCDGQDCVHQGALAAPGRQIICLPHRLWIEVVAAGDEGGQMDVDAAAGVEGAGPGAPGAGAGAAQAEGLDTLSR